MSVLRFLENLDLGTSWAMAAAVAAFAIAVLAITRRASAYVAADRNVPPLLNGLATSAAFLSAAPFVGLAGLMFTLGSDGLPVIVALAAGLVLMSVLLAPALRRSGALTLPDYFARRYGGRLVPLLAMLAVVTCSVALLLMQLSVIATMAAAITWFDAGLPVVAALVVLATALAGGGMRAATWLGIALGMVILIAYLAPLGALALAKHGMPFGHLAYGHSLHELRELEVDMISNGLADAAVLKPHLSQFLQVDYRNTLALMVTVMAATAVLPHVLMRSTVTTSVSATRWSTAWTLLFASAVLAAAPAYAAMSKHEIYSAVAKGVPFADLPDAFASEHVTVHGVPLDLVTSIDSARRPATQLKLTWHSFDFVTPPSAAGDVASMSEHLRTWQPHAFAAWSRLKPEVQDALLAATNERLSQRQHLDAWRTKILPVAAAAEGNDTGKLTLGALGIDPDRAVILGFKLSGIPEGWIALFALGAVLAAFATALATAWVVTQAIGHDLPIIIRGTRPPDQAAAAAHDNPTRTRWTRMAAGLVVFGAGIAAFLSPLADPDLVVRTLSLAAVCLFPALVLGIWWPRATRIGALAGMIAGVAITLTYISITESVAPEPQTQETSSEEAAGAWEDMAALDSAGLPVDAAQQATAAGDHPHAPGWLGIHNRAAAVFGLPLGFLVTILVSLLTRRRQPLAQAALSPSDA